MDKYGWKDGSRQKKNEKKTEIEIENCKQMKRRNAKWDRDPEEPEEDKDQQEELLRFDEMKKKVLRIGIEKKKVFEKLDAVYLPVPTYLPLPTYLYLPTIFQNGSSYNDKVVSRSH